tara:strand:- start:20 stop:232 length:213 start_codon:yes stop_codon:yes gene_type:complete
MNKHLLKIGEILENYKKNLFADGFTYDEANEYMRLIYDKAVYKYRGMNFANMDKDFANSIIADIKKEYNK